LLETYEVLFYAAKPFATILLALAASRMIFLTIENATVLLLQRMKKLILLALQ
jgi:hypothetical protein